MCKSLLLMASALFLSNSVAAAQAAEGASQSSKADMAECEQFRAGADAGFIDDQLDIAICLIDSEDGADLNAAFAYATQAMNAGNKEAKNVVAVMTLHGIGTKANAAQAQSLMEEAASEGSFGAQLTLAEQYIDGGGFYEKDPAKGLELFIAAANGGALKGEDLGYTQWRIGMMYLEGEAASRDEKEAYRWVTLGTDNESSDAMISRAVMLATGEGVEENDPEARLWYARVIDEYRKDLPHALRGLGYMMFIGEGGPVDRAAGCSHINVAFQLGDDKAEELLGIFADELSNGEKSTCNVDAQDWIAEHLKE